MDSAVTLSMIMANCPHCGEDLTVREFREDFHDGPHHYSYILRREIDLRIWLELWHNGQRVARNPLTETQADRLRKIAA